MNDIFLYPGATSPNDVILAYPTSPRQLARLRMLMGMGQ